MNLQVEEILKKHITTVNSFLDENGHNRFTECVEALTSLIEQESERAVREFVEYAKKQHDWELLNHYVGVRNAIDKLAEQHLAERKE